MARDGDTLQTIPLTSTGYVRRNAKRALKDGSVHHNFVYSILPDIDTYRALREAFRGGNTHANRYFAGDVVENVHSADRSSSYPAVMCNCEYTDALIFATNAQIQKLKEDNQKLNDGFSFECKGRKSRIYIK